MYATATLLAALLASALAAPAHATTDAAPLDPARAIALAREHPHAGADGTFRLRVAATGKVRFEHYLNSHPDERPYYYQTHVDVTSADQITVLE